MASRKRIIAQISYATAARYVSVLLLALRGFGLAHLLGPALFGVWSSMRLVLQFSSYSNLGARAGMLQLATRADGAGDSIEAAQLRGTAAGVNFAGAVGVALIIASVAAIEDAVLRPEFWYLLAALVVARNLWLYLQATLRSTQRFGLRSSLSILMATLSTALGLFGAYSYGLGGFLIALGMSYAIGFLVAMPFGGKLPQLALRGDYARRLLALGSPILLANFLKMLMWNLDKLMVWVFLGHKALGIYALQSTISNAVMLLPAGVADVFYPHLVSRIGAAKETDIARRNLAEGTILLVRLMCPILALAFLLLPLPIKWLLPDFVQTIPPGLVLIIAAFFPISSTIAGAVLVALGGQHSLLKASAAGATVAAAAVYLAIFTESGFLGIALGAGAGLLTRAALVLHASMAVSQLPVAERLGLLGRIATSFLALIIVVSALTAVFPAVDDSALRDGMNTAIQCALSLVLLGPGAIISWRRQRLREREA